MRLISISANQQSFKKIDFNSSGASFIIAKQKDLDQSDKNKTYNGVGKSLLVALIDFCLGAGPTSKIVKALKACEPLKDWEFTLKMTIQGKSHTITRSVNNYKNINLNGEDMQLTEFHKRMQELCFDIDGDFNYLSYRSLLPFFLRASKVSYTRYDEPQKFGKPYQKLLCNAFLLGLNIILADKKMELKKQLDARNNSLKDIKDDPIIKEFLGHNHNTMEDYRLWRTNIEEQINKQEKNLNDFKVADDYYQHQEKADQLKQLIDEKQNQIYLCKKTIRRIDKSLQIEADINQNDIKNIYQESQMVFRNEIEKKLLDLEKFYADLRTNRKKRLGDWKISEHKNLAALEKEANVLKELFDKESVFLKSHGALDVFIQLNERLNELKQKRDRLDSYGKLRKSYEKTIKELKQNLTKENQKTDDYLEQNESFLRSISDSFRALVRQFYPFAVASPPTVAGIIFANNEGENTLRYNIEAKIQSDSSDGINNVKLFCYDLSVLLEGSNHHIDFVFHDSRLYSDIDEKHCGILFDIVKSKFKDKQYIASINQKDMRTLPQATQDFIEQYKVCELNDESEKGKLLGMKVELEYD